MEQHAGYYKVFGSAASIIGAILSIFYISFSIFAIGTFNNANYIPTDTGAIDFIYLLFLRDCENTCVDKLNVTSKTFNGFMYFYLVSHIIWLAVNVYYLYVIIRSKWTSFKIILLWWTSNTAIILIVDLILMALLANDLKYIQDLENLIGSFYIYRSVIDSSYVIMFGLVTQFYLFWLVNFVFVIINIYNIFIRSSHPTNYGQNSIIYAYGNRTAPPFSEIYKNPDNAYVNPGYVTDMPSFDRSQSFEDFSNPNKVTNDHADGFSNYFNSGSLKNRQNPNEIQRSRPNNNHYNSFLYGPQNNNRSYSPAGSENNKTATIGRRQGRNITPPLKVASPNPPYPFIPPPDYSPPNSPIPKSILRPNSRF